MIGNKEKFEFVWNVRLIFDLLVCINCIYIYLIKIKSMMISMEIICNWKFYIKKIK